MLSRFATAWLLAAACMQPALAASSTPPAAQSVQAQYQLSLNGVAVAVMNETFEVRDAAYSAVSETRAVGLFALMQRRPGRVTSSGAMTADGLQPRVFDGTRGNKDARRVHAEFDWAESQLKLSHDDRNETLPLPPGTQDRLSVMYQFLFLAPEKLKDLAFPMTNGRKIDNYRYAIGPDTVIDTPLGRMPVVHLVKQRDEGDTATEIWLSREHRLMPVRMRIVEDDGERYEQIIAQLNIRP